MTRRNSTVVKFPIRAVLCQAQSVTAQGGRAHQRGSMANRRPAPRPGSAPRVPELSRQCRIRSHLTQKCSRKELDPGNYTISDYLRGLSASRLGTEIVGPSAAL